MYNVQPLVKPDELPVLYFMPGPLHLFWTTGVFYIYRLCNKYRIIMLLSKNYKKNDRFINLIEGFRNIELVYFDMYKNVLKTHYQLKKKFEKTTKKYHPDMLLTHSRSYIENMYAVYFCKTINSACNIYMYQNGKSSLDWNKSSSVLFNSSVQRFVNKTKLPKFVAVYCVIAFRYFLYTVEYKVIPFFFVGKCFYPFEDVRNFKIIPGNMRRIESSSKEYTLTYLGNEMEQYYKLGFPNVLKVEHPVCDLSNNALSTIFGTIEERDMILVLPTYGLESVEFTKKTSQAEKIDYFSSHWMKAFQAIRNKWPSYMLGLKPHPGAYDDPVWHGVVKKLKLQIPKLQIYDTGITAEKLILESKIIVSDISSTLWWATFLKSKIVVSLDIFGFENGNEMSGYEGVKYINDITDLESTSFEVSYENGVGAMTIEEIMQKQS